MPAKKVSPKKEPIFTLITDQVDVEFLNSMALRMNEKRVTHGDVRDNLDQNFPVLAWQQLSKYHQTGDRIFLVDAANYLMMEAMKNV